MSNIGKRVKIINGYGSGIYDTESITNTIRYEGKIGTVVEDETDICEMRVQFPDGVVKSVRDPDKNSKEAEWVDNLYSIDSIRDKKVIIEGATEEQYKQVLQVFENAGITWMSGNAATYYNYWEDDTKDNHRIGYEGDDRKKLWRPSVSEQADIVITATQFLQDNTNNNMDAQQQIDALKKQISQLEESLKVPVWKPKVGDWVVTTSMSDNYTDEGRIGKKDTVYQVQEIAEGDWYRRTKGKADGAQVQSLRPATNDEIAKSSPQPVIVRIGSDNREVKVSKGKIEVTGNTVSASVLSQLVADMTDHKSISGWDISVDSLTIGCCKSIKPSQLQEIVDAYNKINT